MSGIKVNYFFMLKIMKLKGKIDLAHVPRPFRGAAIGMITAGLINMIFMGFSGLIRI